MVEFGFVTGVEGGEDCFAEGCYLEWRWFGVVFGETGEGFSFVGFRFEYVGVSLEWGVGRFVSSGSVNFVWRSILLYYGQMSK